MRGHLQLLRAEGYSPPAEAGEDILAAGEVVPGFGTRLCSCGRIGASRQKSAECLEVAVGSSPVEWSPATLPQEEKRETEGAVSQT